MLTTNEVAQVFDTILSSPGMNEAVKIDLRISRKTVLLLHQVIEHGISKKGEDDSLIFSSASEDSLAELKGLGNDCLQRAGLVEMSEKLLQLSTSHKK